MEIGKEDMFFSEDGRACFFTEDSLSFDNIKAEKIYNPKSYVQKLSQAEFTAMDLSKENQKILEQYLKFLD